jgi:hypothetical protein
MHPKRTGSSVEAAVIDTEPALSPVGDSTAEWHDAETTDVLTPRQDRPLGGVCLVESQTPVEIKGCIPETGNGDHSTTGRWYIKRQSHDQIEAEKGVYYLTVYAPRPSTPIIAALVVPAATVGDLLAGSWYDSGRQTVAKLSWPRVIDETEVER